MNSIQWLMDLPKRYGDREFLYDTETNESVSYAAMHDSACRIAADLQRRGLEKGDRLMLLLNNSASFAKVYFGCLYAGIVVVPINPVLSRDEIETITSRCGASMMLVSDDTASLVNIPMLLETKVSILKLDDGLRQATDGSQDLESWSVRDLPEAGSFEPFQGMTPEDTISLVFTSGTTGTPSGVVHRIADMVENARAFNQRLEIDETNRFFGVLAMTYLGGYYNLLLLPYCAGASVVLARAFDATSGLRFWNETRRHGVNTLWFVPTILAILLEMDRGKTGEEYCRDHVKLALVGTAPLPVKLRRKFETRYGVTLFENYGLSETFFITTNSWSTRVADGCVGRLLPGVQLTITDAEGEALPDGQEGEIRVSTPHLMDGYYNLDDQQLEPISRYSWFPTGDLGRLTPNGDLFITGRKKNLIIRGGINISPAEIENVVYRHDLVAECAVVGIPHSIYGEDIAVAVRLRSGSFDDVQLEILALCKQHLGGMKQPAHLVELESFPHSSTGKIQHQKVKDILISKLNLHAEPANLPESPAIEGNAPLVLPGRIRHARPETSDEILDGLGQYPASLISDVMNRLGVMVGAIRPLVCGRPFCGRALTVEEVEGGNLMSHAASEMLRPQDVLVIDAKGVTSRACWGGLQTSMAQNRNAAALVIDGVIRDFELVKELSLPVYARGVSPAGPMKGWGGNINFPVACGGVVVCAGDIVRGDDDGVVVVPHDLAESVLECCQRRLQLEEGWFAKVEAGQSTVDAVGLREKLNQFGLDVSAPPRRAMGRPAA